MAIINDCIAAVAMIIRRRRWRLVVVVVARAPISDWKVFGWRPCVAPNGIFVSPSLFAHELAV
jgi:hypothetical protein